MFKVFQKEMSIDRIICICHVFLLRQKFDLSDSIIDLENFMCLDRTLMNVCDFLLMKEKEE